MRGGTGFCRQGRKPFKSTSLPSVLQKILGAGSVYWRRNSCEYHTLADVRQKIPRQAYPEAANIGEAELGAFLHLCEAQASCELLQMNEAQEGTRSVGAMIPGCRSQTPRVNYNNNRCY